MPEEVTKSWPVVQVRIARPTDKLEKVVRFYSEGLGLQVLGSFKDHAGYDGVMLGLPGFPYHLEFTSHKNGSPYPAPTPDNLLVLYIPDREKLNGMVKQLKSIDCIPVAPENPYWLKDGLTFEDPDKWRVVLMNTSGIGNY